VILRFLHSRQLVAAFLSAATGMALFFTAPFPEGNLFLQIAAAKASAAFLFLKYSYILFLYTTPFIAYSIVLSGLYIFALKTRAGIREGKLPPYPDPQKRTDLSIVVGEVHHARSRIPPGWRFPNGGYSPGSLSSAPWALEKRHRPCTHSLSRFWRSRRQTRRAASVGSSWK
jgi:hypothetical protein